MSMVVYTITGEDRHGPASKQLRIYRVLLKDGLVSHLKDWEIARFSGVKRKKVNATLKEMEEAGLLTRETKEIEPPKGHEGQPWKERTIHLHYDRIQEASSIPAQEVRSMRDFFETELEPEEIPGFEGRC